ncbi:MFS polyamine transporter [Amanita muscaria]
MSDMPRSSITFTVVPSRPRSSHIGEFGRGDGQTRLHSPVEEEAETAETDANLVTWDGPHDPENPKNWPNGYKWLITIVAIAMTVNVTFASSAPAFTSRMLMIQFGISAEVSYLVTSCFLLGYVFGPLFWGPGSELVGRRPIFLVTMVLYTLFHLGQALAPNIQTLLVARFLSGFFAVAPLTNSSGVIADIFSAETRGSAASLFTAGVFFGPVLGPVVSGFIVESQVSWRWVYWAMMMFAGTCTLIMILLLPETYAPVILLRKAKRLRKADPVVNVKIYAEHERQDWSISGVIKRTIFRPFHMLAMEPVLILITIYVSMIYGLLYALFETLPIIFIERRGFTVRQGGLVFIGVGLGTTFGCLINARLSSHYPALIKRWKGFPPPEQRLRGAMIGAPTLVIAIFWLGWTGEYSSIPWYVPALSTVPLGMSISLTFITFLSYLIDTYLMYSASAFAANIIVRSAMAAAFPLFIVQMFRKLHINWATTLLGLIALLFVPCPFLFFKYGSRIRAKSRFAPCIDLKIAKELEAEERRLAEKKVVEIY